MTQEINIKLRADTREAVKSVKDLEREVSNLENVQRRGEADKGFLSQDDVKRFRRMSDEAAKVYQQFLEKFNRIKRELDQKKQELATAMSNGANQTTIQQLQNQVQQLQNRHNVYQSQQGYMNHLNQQGQNTIGNINNMNSPGFMSQALMFTKRFLPMLGVTLGAGMLASFVKQGANQIKVDEAYMSKLGQRVSGFNGDFEKGRKEAEQLGIKNGNAYNALETMQTAENWTSQAGAKNKKEMWSATTEIQTTSRVLGLDPSELGSQMGSLGKIGALTYKDIKAFREGMVGAIKETGMAGRDREFVQAVTGLSQQVGRGQMEFSNGEMNQVLGLQTILGRTGLKGFQGEKGAEVLSALDNGVKGNDNAIDMMLGWGTKYTGPKGRAELERLKGRGISDPELLKTLMTNVGGLYNGDKDQQALWLKDKFGISMEQSDALLQPEVMEQLKKGGMSKKEISQLMKDGGKSSKKKSKDWQDSQAQRRAENDAKWQNTKKAGGSWWDKLWEGSKELFLGQPQGLQWAELGAGALGGGWAGNKAIGGLMRLFATRNGGQGGAGLLSRLFGGGGSGGGSIMSRLSQAGGSLAGWGKNMLPFLGHASNVASVLMLHGSEDPAIKKSREEKPRRSHSGISKNDYEIAKEKLKHPEWYPDLSKSQKTEAQRIVNTYEGKKKEKETEEKKKLVQKQEQIVTREAININTRKSQTEADHQVLDKEKKNLDEMKNLLGSESGSGSSTSGGSGGGFFSKLWEGAKSLWNNLFGTETASASGGNNNYAPTNVSNSTYLNQNLKKSNQELTAQDIDGWINSKAGKNSLMRGKGAEFLKAAQDSGLDARYLVAHAGLETGWGDPKNGYAKDGNWFGIGAFDSNPDNAKNYGNGIGWGAKWIADNYVNKGQDTVYKMRNNGGNHEYATDPLWDDKIAAIMASGPKGTASTINLNVKVSGGVDGLTKENNNIVTQALTNSVTDNVNLAYEFRQGIGGFA